MLGRQALLLPLDATRTVYNNPSRLFGRFSNARGPSVACWRWKPLAGWRMRVTEHRTCAEACEAPLALPRAPVPTLIVFASLFNRDAFYPDCIVSVPLPFFPYPLSRVIFSYPPVASYIFFIYIFLLFLRQRVQTRLRVRGASFSFTRRDDPCELDLVFVEDFIEYKRIWIDDRLLIKIIDLYVFFKYTKFMIL